MIEVLILKSQKKTYEGFQMIGHAEYAEEGEDIVCAGASALVITAINSIEAFTDDHFQLISEEEEGLMSLTFDDVPGHDSCLLLDSMILGLQDIQKSYGNEYINLIFEEV